MRCDHVEPLLSAYADGELPQTLADKVADHLAGCPACAAEWRSLASLVEALQALPEEEPPAYLRASIFEALDAAQPSLWQRLCALTAPFLPGPSLAYGAAAAGLLALVLCVAPVQRGVLYNQPVFRIAYSAPTFPLPATGAVEVAPRQATTPSEAVPGSRPGGASANPLVIASVPQEMVGAGSRRSSIPAAKAAAYPSRRAGRNAPARLTSPDGGTAPDTASAAPKFDPTVPVLDASDSLTGVPAATETATATPTAPPATETTLIASVPASPETTTTTAAGDDLEALRQRLAQEQVQLPMPQFVSHRRKQSGISLFRSEF